jgi:hypothetical protein
MHTPSRFNKALSHTSHTLSLTCYHTDSNLLMSKKSFTIMHIYSHGWVSAYRYPCWYQPTDTRVGISLQIHVLVSAYRYTCWYQPTDTRVGISLQVRVLVLAYRYTRTVSRLINHKLSCYSVSKRIARCLFFKTRKYRYPCWLRAMTTRHLLHACKWIYVYTKSYSRSCEHAVNPPKHAHIHAYALDTYTIRTNVLRARSNPEIIHKSTRPQTLFTRRLHGPVLCNHDHGLMASLVTVTSSHLLLVTRHHIITPASPRNGPSQGSLLCPSSQASEPPAYARRRRRPPAGSRRAFCVSDCRSSGAERCSVVRSLRPETLLARGRAPALCCLCQYVCVRLCLLSCFVTCVWTRVLSCMRVYVY